MHQHQMEVIVLMSPERLYYSLSDSANNKIRIAQNNDRFWEQFQDFPHMRRTLAKSANIMEYTDAVPIETNAAQTILSLMHMLYL